MWIICLEDNSLEMSRLFSLRKKKKKKNFKMRSAVVVIGALRDNKYDKVQFYLTPVIL